MVTGPASLRLWVFRTARHNHANPALRGPRASLPHVRRLRNSVRPKARSPAARPAIPKPSARLSFESSSSSLSVRLGRRRWRCRSGGLALSRLDREARGGLVGVGRADPTHDLAVRVRLSRWEGQCLPGRVRHVDAEAELVNSPTPISPPDQVTTRPSWVRVQPGFGWKPTSSSPSGSWTLSFTVGDVFLSGNAQREPAEAVGGSGPRVQRHVRRCDGRENESGQRCKEECDVGFSCQVLSRTARRSAGDS